MLLYQQLNMQFGIEARFAISSFRHRGFSQGPPGTKGAIAEGESGEKFIWARGEYPA